MKGLSTQYPGNYNMNPIELRNKNEDFLDIPRKARECLTYIVPALDPYPGR